MSRAFWLSPLAVSVAAVAGGLGGCGEEPLRPPSLTTPAAPSGMLPIRLPNAGAALTVPANWSRLNPSGPEVALVTSGSATVALWRFPRRGSEPAGAGGLAAALGSLEAAARRRDPGLRVLAAATGRLDGHGAVILDVIGQVASATRRIRSEHVYLPGAELVLDAYAPPRLFTRVDRQVFSPVRHSLRLLAAVAGTGTLTGTGTATTTTTITTTTTP